MSHWDAVSLVPPTSSEEAQSSSLECLIDRISPLASPDNIVLREKLLLHLQKIFVEFVKAEAILQSQPQHYIATCGGRVLAFGSFHLGITTDSSDMDLLAISPRHVTREAFFERFPQRLNEIEGVHDVIAVPEASAPVLRFMVNDMDFDIVFARLNVSQVPTDLRDISSDEYLKNLDEKSSRCVNGVRVADGILSKVSKPKLFRMALRCIRYWAKQRGLYGNAVGFLGGVTWAILTARICQMYPNACPGTIVRKFFSVYAKWDWKAPAPVTLGPIKISKEVGLMGYRVWNPKLYAGDKGHVMPIITPAFPAMNSTYNVPECTKRLVIAELKRASEILEGALSTGSDGLDAAFVKAAERPSFLSDHTHYLVMQICRSESQGIESSTPSAAAAEQEVKKLQGFMESRLKGLYVSLLHAPGVASVRPWPGAFFEDRMTPTYFVGFALKPAQANQQPVDLKELLSSYITKLTDESSGFDWKASRMFASAKFGYTTNAIAFATANGLPEVEVALFYKEKNSTDAESPSGKRFKSNEPGPGPASKSTPAEHSGLLLDI